MTSELGINGKRLWDSLMAMAQIGATPNGGVRRLAASEADKAGRDLFSSWCEEAGCAVTADQIGNLFARREGRNKDAPPIVMGSHLDSQPTGGKFDGVYGVLAGLEVIRTLNDFHIETAAPIEVAVWMNEEGARFSPAMLGSGVFSGVFSLEYGLSRADESGVTLGDALVRNNLAGQLHARKTLGAHFEAHIEQGPVLENENKIIGVVTGVQGIKWFDATIKGAECHAGPTPMHLRIDPVQAVAPLLIKIFQLAEGNAPDARVTIGEIRSHPNSRNTVPGKITFSIDLRHPDSSVLAAMSRELEMLIQTESVAGCQFELNEIWHSPPVSFDAECIAAIRDAAEKTRQPYMEIVSGAGHDSVYLSRVTPTGMIFVPCKGGVSHNEAESADPDHLAAGCNVLLQAVLSRAGEYSANIDGR